MIEVHPPASFPASAFEKHGEYRSRYYIFLAGTIEMGKADDWQRDFVEHFSDFDDDLVILNPRRPDWDSSWEQSIKDPHFRKQVEWELRGLEKADLVVMNLVPGSLSPISLLELGLVADRAGRLLVCCPPGFWRRGNVEVVLNRYGGHLFDDVDAWFKAIRVEIELLRI